MVGKCVASRTQTRTMRRLWRYRHFADALRGVKSRFGNIRHFFSCSG
ncbi:hypothetical protein C4J96_3114 [Pseudomonas orientalis]|nr:hypothetical protein C4J96_3114 [Pseudomonas orientalis]